MVMLSFGVFYINDLVLFAKKTRDHVSCVFCGKNFPVEAKYRLA